ncbi:3-hydroxyanthranilate 3,4-dioxygenase [Bacteriovoracaceae bacterium]|nr:3-hydroxyanthranilate 3,4-dioxygenase [Bacteriovoracaceae bacterium]
MLPPINLQKLINDIEPELMPPVSNKMIYQDSTFIIMLVGGPNSRHDYHINQTDEFFYQIKGDMNLKMRTKEGEFVDQFIKEGEIYLLEAGIPHSPQRFENTIGLVFEKTREVNEQDSFVWYCPKCKNLLYKESFHLTNIETQVKMAIENFNINIENKTCDQCGTVHE